MSEDSESDEETLGSEWYEEKSARMVELLGAEHDSVMHSMIPYAFGGALDLYYYPNGIVGTGIATKELCELPGQSASNDWYENYELVMFTRRAIDLEHANDVGHPFGKIHRRLNAILNCMARYSAEATLNPGETCEFPEEMEELGGRCLIFDAYKDREDETEFGLLLLMEVYREEMEFAREMGSHVLLDLLKSKGHYPYSDLDRAPVVEANR